MAKSKAMVTLTIGKKHEDLFERVCRPSWAMYAERFGYDLIVINEPLDKGDRARRRSPAWQKLLILSQSWSEKYDRLVWVDSDVIVNLTSAEDICENNPEHQVGAVDAYSMPTRDIHKIAVDRLCLSWESRGIPYLDCRTPELFYKNRGIAPGKVDKVVQTGVFTCSWRHHRELFEHIYHSYEDEHGPEWNYEMPAMSFELLRNEKISWISSKFNTLVYECLAAFYPELLGESNRPDHQLASKIGRKVRKKLGLSYQRSPTVPAEQIRALKNIYDLSVFCHFAGCHHLMWPFSEAMSRSR